MNAKADARTNVKNYLDDLPNKGVHRCFELGVRINSVSSQLIHDDLKVLNSFCVIFRKFYSISIN